MEREKEKSVWGGGGGGGGGEEGTLTSSGKDWVENEKSAGTEHTIK